MAVAGTDDAAVAAHALARGFVTPAQLEQARRRQAAFAAAGQPTDLLGALRAALVPAHVEELRRLVGEAPAPGIGATMAGRQTLPPQQHPVDGPADRGAPPSPMATMPPQAPFDAPGGRGPSPSPMATMPPQAPFDAPRGRGPSPGGRGPSPGPMATMPPQQHPVEPRAPGVARAETLPPGPAPAPAPARSTGPRPSLEPAPGEVIGPYVVVRELARGGMGAVYLAEQPGAGRRVALKVRLGHDAKGAERFVVEGRAAARLRHPSIVQVHEIGVDARGRQFLAMDLVEGESLEHRLDERGPLAPLVAARLGVALARAVEHAHAHGVLHRDLKPANVLLQAPDDVPVLTDFGLAKQVEGTGDGEALTRTGDILGTPPYMPPEQALGRAADARSDVWGLGATLYHALSGRPPFEGRSVVAVLAAVLKADPPALVALRPDVPPALEAVVRRCMTKDPAARYASMGELAADLELFIAGAATSAEREVARRGREGASRRSLAALVVVVALIAAVAIGRRLVTGGGDEPTIAPVASPRRPEPPRPLAPPPAATVEDRTWTALRAVDATPGWPRAVRWWRWWRRDEAAPDAALLARLTAEPLVALRARIEGEAGDGWPAGQTSWPQVSATGWRISVQNRMSSVAHVLLADPQEESAGWEVELAARVAEMTNDLLIHGAELTHRRSTGRARLAYVAGRRELTVADEVRPGRFSSRTITLPEPMAGEGYVGWVPCLAWSPDGERLVIGGRWATLLVLQGDASVVTPLGGIGSLARGLAVLDGERPDRVLCRTWQLATFDPGGAYTVRPLPEPGMVGPRVRPGTAQVALVSTTSVALCASPGPAGAIEVTGGARLPPSPPSPLFGASGAPDPDLEFAPDGRALYVTTPTRLVRFEVDAEGAPHSPRVLGGAGDGGVFTSVAVAAEGAWVVVGVADEARGPRLEVWAAPPRSIR